MSRPLLPESSWYIKLARNKQDPLLELALVAESRTISTCGMVVSEVGRGLKTKELLEWYTTAWDGMFWIDSSTEVWDRTLELVWTLDRKGIVLPIQDVHIAACALEISAVVLTFDNHFKYIPHLKVSDCLY